MKARIHYHTDCPSFAGCENMLANLVNDPEIRCQFEVSFSYRNSAEYTSGLKRNTRLDFPVFPLHFPEPSTALPVSIRWPRSVRRGVRFVSRQVATYPLLIYEICLLWRLFSRLAPDVLHINNGGYPAALSARAAAIAARMAGIRSVVMVVNNMAEAYRPGPLSIRPVVDREVVKGVSCFITGSVAASVRIAGVLGLRDGHSVAYPNGIALRAPSESRDETLRRLRIGAAGGVLLGMVGVMEPRKGHLVLLDAVIELVRDGPPDPGFTVLLEGDGPLRAELEAYTRSSGLERYCRFVGTESNIMNLMSAIDVLVLPSIAHEDFPNVILEAMGYGKPVIASRLAGTPEQVEEEITGLLVPPGDSQALAVAIARLVCDVSVREQMGRAGRQRFERSFTAPAAVRRYAALYQSLIIERTS